VALDQPVTLKLAGVRLESTLNLLLRPLQLDWVVQDEVLKITTSTWAYQNPETRTYDIQKLIDAGHSPDEVIASIIKCVEPGTWTGKDAIAGISHTGGVLVVRHSQRTQGEIGRLLDELEDIATGDDEDKGGGGKHSVVSVKVYPTGDQPAAVLAAALQEFVECESWKSNRDGKGEGQVQALNAALVVKQTAHVHRSIQQFLAQFERHTSVVHVAPEMPPSPATGAPAHAGTDPFGVLDSAIRPARGARTAPADRPKWPVKMK
jgi:hypothetical protein